MTRIVKALEDCYHDMELKREGQKFEWKQEGPLPEYVEQLSGEVVPVVPVKTEQDHKRDAKIVEAVQSLDHKNDDHWTKAGLPSLDAVSDITGFDVSRPDIKVNCPEAQREK